MFANRYAADIRDFILKELNVKKLLFILLLCLAQQMTAQNLKGVIVDAESGDSIPFVTLQYKGVAKKTTADYRGIFSIEKRKEQYLILSAVGYKTLKILITEGTNERMLITMKPDSRSLSGVTIKAKKGKYRRKENPAVALMRRVIAAKKRTSLENHDFYSYDKYQKLTLGVNDLQEKDLLSGMFRRSKWMLDHVEVSPYNGKRVMPLSVDETVTHYQYRKSPKDEKETILGNKIEGMSELFTTGETLTNIIKDVFTDVDLYDDQIRLLRSRFISPIGSDAVAFYRFYIEDTTYVEKDLCYHLQFTPNNPQDFGFRGEIWVLADSTLHVRRCEMTLPKNNGVNFVENMQIKQEYELLDNKDWVLSQDDIIVEMSVLDFLTKAIVARTTRKTNYNFSPIGKREFRGKAPINMHPDAKQRSAEFWAQNRKAPLTGCEATMSGFVRKLKRSKNFGIVMIGVKAVVENFIETGSEKTPSKVDLGPVVSTISRNFIDGIRTRLSARTTGNLNHHFFLDGYVARGWKSKKNYYKGELTYSLNKKVYSPYEFPKRTITFSSTRDVMAPTDKFLNVDKDNVFAAFKWTKVEEMMFYDRQKLSFEYETLWNFKTTVSFKRESNTACGKLFFTPLNQEEQQGKGLNNGRIRTTEAFVELRWAPGETYINTKQRRIAMNHESPVFTLSHTMGFNGLLGGDWKYNFTEASIYNRFWLKSWGKLDMTLKAGAQWDRVPFPLLIMPAANLSYMFSTGTFSMINNMEFLNDRYASVDLGWDLNGKIFNRIPLLKKLKWREYLGVKCLWGDLSKKNNPFVEQNQGSGKLMWFPEGANVMDPNKPYVEIAAGIHNIFRVLHVQYVRRLTYTDLPNVKKNGIRFKLEFSF